MIHRKLGIKGGTLRNGVRGAQVTTVQDSKLIESEFYQGKPRRYNKRALRLVEAMSKRMVKTASSCGTGAGAGYGGTTLLSSPKFYHPEYEPSSLLMPRDPIEINAWCRYFYKYDALVSTAVDSHAELPLSTLKLAKPETTSQAKSKRILEKYEEMCSTEHLDLFNKLLQIGVEHYKLGNVFPFTQWSEKLQMWNRMTLLDPDYVEVDKLQFTDKMRVDLRPSDRLKEVISNGPEHIKTGILYKSIPEDVRMLIQTGKKIPLNTNPNDGSHVSHIAYKMSDYDTLGTGLIERNFKPLVYKDRLRQSQDAIAARHLTPKHLIWGDAMGGMDVDAVREQVDNSFADPDYAIITNFELHWELVGTHTGLMPLDAEWNWLNEELMIGLMINKAFLLGEGSYANGQTVLEVLNQKYSIYRERLESYIIRSLFLPMAKKNDYAEYDIGTAKKDRRIKYVYPAIKWSRLNFVDDTAHKQMLSQMATQGQIDLQTWLESFGLDAETVKERLKRFEGTQLDVNYFAERQALAAEVGRALAPAITKLRADALGLKIPKEGEEAGRFSSKNDKFIKLAEEVEKVADTREERESEKVLNDLKKKKRKIVKNLAEIDDSQGVNPPRKDLQKVKEFRGSLEPYEDIPFTDENKVAEIKQEFHKEESSRSSWINKMTKLGLNQNARRAALSLENEFISMNGSGTPKNRIKVFSTYFPQILASKIEEELPIENKVSLVKERYKDVLSSLNYQMESKLENEKNPVTIKTVIRNTIEKAFESNV